MGSVLTLIQSCVAFLGANSALMLFCNCALLSVMRWNDS